jgi:hypothetical protein
MLLILIAVLFAILLSEKFFQLGFAGVLRD